ncbi:unnamed protein product [Symbiodinium natans]|uniref:Reverse transcriptase domain-containing protein n=1 Tax=Symbiodinium natans TaxID=878477 RepID=A0A812TEC5_9DINO|nr:unnamed protein product [Symbiodinium natans]
MPSSHARQPSADSTYSCTSSSSSSAGPDEGASPSVKMPSQGTASPPRLLLDLFSGSTAPLSAAARALGLDCVEPIDARINAKHNILQDDFFRVMQRLCWSGLIGFIWSAPPCAEFSRLKLLPGGPKPLRTPEHMDGVPNLTSAEQRRVNDSTEIHQRSRTLLRASFAKGSAGGFEQPPNAMSWLQPDNVHLLKEIGATCAHVAACAHDLDVHKSWAFCGTNKELANLQSTCQHGEGAHTRLQNKRTATGEFMSSQCAAYPPSLAAQLASIAALSVTQKLGSTIGIQQALSLLPSEFSPIPRPIVCDGSGNSSTADQCLPQQSTCLKQLREAFLAFIADHDLATRIRKHLEAAKDEHPLSQEEQLQLAAIAHAIIHPNCTDANCLSIREDQPFRLHLLQALASRTADPDEKLVEILIEGVPTGAFEPLPASGQWIANHFSTATHFDEPLQLLHCSGNWTRAENNPDILQELINKELQGNYIEEFLGNEEDAKKRWPKGTAIGKLNVVLAEGRDPRMVLDSTICNLNPRCTLPERMQMPTVCDVQLTYAPHDPPGFWHGLSLDFKAAHKACVVREDERGTLLFRHKDKLYFYKVCHFGARFSSYWWQRLGSVLHRIMHHLISHRPHRSFLYVDDIFAMLAAQHSTELTCLIICFLAAVNAPISWKKAQIGHCITWCGWSFDLLTDTVQLVQTKICKLLEQLAALRRTPKVHRRALEAVLGLLTWATTMSPQLRPFLAPLYNDLHSAKGTLHSIPASQWTHFYQSLDDRACVQHTAGMWLPKQAKLLEVGNIKIESKADVPRVPKSSQRTWVRLADPHRHEVHLKRQSRDALLWLEQVFKHSNRVPLQLPAMLQCLSAADAMAKGTKVGIGGWICTSSGFAWFSEIFCMTEVRAIWPQLKDDAQLYIACFEVLAQLALLQLAWQRMRGHRMQFILPTGCDNTAAESGINKLFSTAEPLSTFLRMVADWAHRHNVQLAVSHLAGEKNTWADELSRDKLHRFIHRNAERVRMPLAFLAENCQCISLHPPDAHWPNSLLAASS